MRWLLTAVLVLTTTAAAASPAHGAALPLADQAVAGTAVLMDADDGTRAALSCTNTSTSVHVRWGDVSVTATKGQRVPAGAAIEIRDSGPLYMISEGASVTMTCTKGFK